VPDCLFEKMIQCITAGLNIFCEIRCYLLLNQKAQYILQHHFIPLTKQEASSGMLKVEPEQGGAREGEAEQSQKSEYLEGGHPPSLLTPTP
jgi:hypothetical protein